MVAIEDRARLVPGDRHGNALGDARVHHVADRGASAVVSQLAGDASVLARRRPGPAKVADALPDVAASQVRKGVRDDAVDPPLEGAHPLDLGSELRLEIGRQIDHPTVVVLCGARVQAQPRGAAEISLEGWPGQVLSNQHGKLIALPNSWCLGWQDAFRWRLYECFSDRDVRIRFCAKMECREAFVPRKGQTYCKKACAPSGAKRNRDYRKRHQEELNKKRRRAYDARRRAELGPKVRIRARKPR